VVESSVAWARETRAGDGELAAGAGPMLIDDGAR
jgi:hypothetical protein